MRAYCSPSRFAVCCVLLRQIVPRHSPYALSSLTTCELYLSIYFFLFLESVWCSTLKSLFRLSEKISLFFFLQTFLSIVSLYSVFNVPYFECSTLKTKQYRLIRNLFFKFMLLRKEVIHPHVPVGIPCYDFTPIIDPTFDSSLSCELGHRLRVLSTLMV